MNCNSFINNIYSGVGGRIAIVHHWDCDGVSSAAILSKILRGFEKLFVVPKIGFYSAEAVDTSIIKQYNPGALIILDYGISLAEIKKLEGRVEARVYVIDHHVSDVRGGFYCNPVANGFPGQEYPSTTWVIYKYLKPRGMEDLVSLGVIGDLGRSLERHWIKQWVLKVASEHGLGLNDLFRATENIDSCYKLLDRKCIDHARRVLEEEGVKNIIDDKVLEEKKSKVEREVLKILENISPVEEHGIIRIYSMEKNLYITSSIGRELAYRSQDKIVILRHKIPLLNIEYLYVRSHAYSLRTVLEELKKHRIDVGGKDRVFVVTCMKSCPEEIIYLVENTILKHATNIKDRVA